MKKELELKNFIEGMELTILTEDDAILLDGVIGTGTDEFNAICKTDANCGHQMCTNNCQGGNCNNNCGAQG